MDPSPLGLSGGSDLDHRLDVHPWQLAPLDHLDPDLNARMECEQEESGSGQKHTHTETHTHTPIPAPKEPEISGTILIAGFWEGS